jgi:hypothetical protein
VEECGEELGLTSTAKKKRASSARPMNEVEAKR